MREQTDSAFTKATKNPDSELNFKDPLNFKSFSSKNIVGLSFTETQDNAVVIVRKLRERFKQKGYFIYISELNFGNSPDKLTILKTSDKYDLLRYEGTNGINYNIFVEDIIEKLTIWDKEFGIDFLGVGFDFVQADYSKLPADLNNYSKELYEFCPDIVDQGTGTIDALKTEIFNTKQLYLWWD